MAFQDELRATIEDSLNQRNERDAKHQGFRDAWAKKRDVVATVAGRAAEVMKTFRGLDAKYSFRNGSEISVTVDYFGSTYVLQFVSDDASMEIVCSSPDVLDNESYAVERLDEATIERKISDFIRVVLLKEPKKPAGGSRPLPFGR